MAIASAAFAGPPREAANLAEAVGTATLGIALESPESEPSPTPLPAGPRAPINIDGCLHLTATASADVIAMRLQAGAPAILQVDLGNDGLADFAYDRDQFDCIVVDLLGGDDQLVIDESNGVFTDAESTTVLGGKGADTLFGGSGGETFNGGAGNDAAFLGAGDDRFVWSPGGDTDLIEGAEGIDIVEVHGAGRDESFTVTANGTRVRFDRVSPAPFFLDIGGCEGLVLNAGGGADTLACTGNLAALIQITADGGDGDDQLLGSNGPDMLSGGEGNDFIDAQQGTDTVLLGAGEDTFQWDPGDGNDTIEGQDGEDVIVFNGSNAGETLDLSATGQRLRFTRNIGSVVMDVGGVEQFDLRTLGGADIVNVNELEGAGLTRVNVDLAGTLTGGAGDAQADAVVILGTPGADAFDLSADGDFVAVDVGADLRVRGYEASDQITINGVGGDVVNVNGSADADNVTIVANGTQARVDATGFSLGLGVSGALSLAINTLDGPDMVSCVGALAALVPITLDGGSGDDTLLGSNGPDMLIGGDDNDFIDGQQGADTALLGAGDDVFQWDPGDGNDVVEGQGGADGMSFNGSNAGEILDCSANGQRLRLTRNIGSVVMDVDGVEDVTLRTLGSADTIIVNDLAGTDLIQLDIALAGTLGGDAGDAQLDTVIVNGTSGADDLSVVSGFTGTLVLGSAVLVNISGVEAALDRLTINALAGDDRVQASGLAAGVIGLTFNGGPGDDTLIGSHGADALFGGDDDDTLMGGPGADQMVGDAGADLLVSNPGDGSDLVEGGADIDTVEVNGGAGAEDFTVTANGTLVRFDRIHPAPSFLDIGTCEELVLNADGGADTLACTGNLAPLIRITADGGAGEDALLGSNGADLLIGGDDGDFIDGQQGADTILAGAGDDTVQWDPGDGNDIVEGQAGLDELVFNGSSATEIFDFSPNGQRLRFTRNIASIVMDVDGVEAFSLRALGAADAVTVNSLAGTAVTEVNLELAGTLGGASGDAAVDTITVNGTQAADSIHVAANAGAVEVSGLSSIVRVLHAEAASDQLTINGLGGTDTITSGPGVAGLILLQINQ